MVIPIWKEMRDKKKNAGGDQDVELAQFFGLAGAWAKYYGH